MKPLIITLILFSLIVTGCKQKKPAPGASNAQNQNTALEQDSADADPGLFDTNDYLDQALEELESVE